MNSILVLAVPVIASVAFFWACRPRRAIPSERVAFELADEWHRWPEHIRLLRLDDEAERIPVAMSRRADQLRQEGFDDAGAFCVEEIPQLTLHVLAHRAHSLYATLWHHEAEGAWFEFTCGYPGGNSWTFTTLSAGGFSGRHGDTTVRAPGAELLELYIRACSERPMSVYLPVSVERAVPDFEKRCAMWMTWQRAEERNTRVA